MAGASSDRERSDGIPRGPQRRSRGDPDISDHQTGQDQPRAGRAPRLRRRASTGLRPPPRRGRPPGRISSQYYTKLERGNATGISDSVIDGIARALQLDEAERTHFVDLIRAAGTTRAPRRAGPERVRPTVQRVLDSMIGTPALVLNARLDIVTANELGYALFSPLYADPVRPVNNARFVFLDPHATEFFRDWDKVANDTVAILHAEAGLHPYDRRLFDLIGELSTRSDDFRRRWAAHDIQIHTTGIKLIHHPGVGDLDLSYESFPLAADLSQSLLTYTADPGSPTQDALTLLATWAASTMHHSNASEHENT
jgi:hypothetical protein